MAASYDKLAGVLAAACLVSQRMLTPRRDRWTAHIMSAAVTTAVGVIDRIHNDTTDARTLTFVAIAAGFADLDVLVLFVADDADGRHAVLINQADFAAR